MSRMALRPRVRSPSADAHVSARPDPRHELRHETPDRRAAFERYAEHAGETFRSELYEWEQPRQLLFLTIAVAVLIYLAFARNVGKNDDEFDNRSNAQAAYLAVTAMFCFYGATQFRDSLMVRPHPMVWRVIHAVAVVYLLTLSMLFVQTLEGARNTIRLLSPQKIEDFKPLDPFTSENCAISWEAVMRQFASPWVASHFLGWIGKMCLFRDIKYCMVSSLLFELAELSLQFVIPEFKECWWDSIFIDFLGANTLGIIVGNMLIKFLNKRNFDWLDEDITDGEPESPKRKVPRLERFVDLVMPFSWTEYRWQFFSTFPRFAAMVFMTVVQLGIDLNAFFLLHSLQIPVSNKLNHARLLLLALLALPAASEWYHYIDGKMARIGPNMWLLVAVCILEWLVILKMGIAIEQFHRLPPLEVVVPWSLCLLFCTLFVAFYYQSRIRAWLTVPLPIRLFDKTLFVLTRARVLALLHLCAVLPLIGLTINWKF